MTQRRTARGSTRTYGWHSSVLPCSLAPHSWAAISTAAAWIAGATASSSNSACRRGSPRRSASAIRSSARNRSNGCSAAYANTCCYAAQPAKRMVAMPSQVVDVAWHELILHTRLYQHVCRKGLGRFLHHTPAQAMRSPTGPGGHPARLEAGLPPRGHRPTESHAPTAAVRPRHGTGDRRRLPLRPELRAAAGRRRSGVLRQPYRLQQRLRQR